MAVDYKSAGVDVERGYEAVKLMKEYVKKTYNSSAMCDIGSFGGYIALDDKPDGDCLVAGTDGVGTKLKYAFILDKHDTIGIDAVAMCVNDIICQGAKPLMFLDYIAQAKIIPEKVADIVKGVSEGCCQAGCVLVGGETAEMPGFYADDEYDIAGFSVGIAKKNKIIDGSKVKVGDTLVGIASSGIHSNGYSLVRKLFGEDRENLNKYNATLGCAPADVILTPTKIYVKSILSLIEQFEIKGLAHITGGGFIENVPRTLPKGMGAYIDRNSYPLPKVFKALQELANIDDDKMCNTFNMGIGMVAVVDPAIANNVVDALNKMGETAYIIGKVTDKEGVQF